MTGPLRGPWKEQVGGRQPSQRAELQAVYLVIHCVRKGNAFRSDSTVSSGRGSGYLVRGLEGGRVTDRG